MSEEDAPPIYDSDPSEDTSWLVTYGDMVTLLMVFFVLMFSASKINEEKYDLVAQSISQGFDSPGPDASMNPTTAASQTVESPLEVAKAKFDELVIERNLQGEMSASLSPYGLKIELSSNSLFNSGSADVKGSMQSSLTDLSGIIQGLGEEDYIVEVEGHTDNVPIKTAKFPSNWELSSLRAVNVAKLFESVGVKKNQLSAIAYADTRPKLPNLDSDGSAVPENQAKNRRVVVHVKSLNEMNEANND